MNITENDIMMLGNTSLAHMHNNIDKTVEHAMKQFNGSRATPEIIEAIARSLSTFLSTSIDILDDGIATLIEETLSDIEATTEGVIQ